MDSEAEKCAPMRGRGARRDGRAQRRGDVPPLSLLVQPVRHPTKDRIGRDADDNGFGVGVWWVSIRDEGRGGGDRIGRDADDSESIVVRADDPADGGAVIVVVHRRQTREQLLNEVLVAEFHPPSTSMIRTPAPRPPGRLHAARASTPSGAGDR